MPRVYDYIRCVDEGDCEFLEPIRYGRSEMTEDEYDGPDDLQEFCMRHAHFSAGFNYPHPMDPEYESIRKEGDPRLGTVQAQFDVIHEWLGETMTGPWYWSESWSNNGHSLDIDIHIERISDQRTFLTTWEDLNLFSYRPYTDNDIESLAVMKGALPSTESFFKWWSDNQGADFSIIDDSVSPPIVDVRILYPELEELFRKDWGDRFTYDPRRGTFRGLCYEARRELNRYWDFQETQKGCLKTLFNVWAQSCMLAGPARADEVAGNLIRDVAALRFRPESLYLWCNRHEAFPQILNDRNIGGNEKQESGKLRMSYRAAYPSAADAFRKKWGKYFVEVIDSVTGDLIGFTGNPPDKQKREVPLAFLDYLEGRCEWGDIQKRSSPKKITLAPEP